MTATCKSAIIDPILVTFGQMCNFRDLNLVTLYLCMYLVVNEEHFTFHLQYKHSGTFANYKYEELSYHKNQKTCGPILATLGSLSTSVFETRTATGSELFSLLTCPHTVTFTLLSIFSPLETSSIKIWEKILS